ncbi:MAG: phosphoenolpyruvate carboxykinase (ATP) [Adlercreutzia equolifaciens]
MRTSPRQGRQDRLRRQERDREHPRFLPHRPHREDRPPASAAPAAKNVIFLSADAFGVLPPVSILTADQTEYYFLSASRQAGRHRARHHRATPTFSACFGQAFRVASHQVRSGTGQAHEGQRRQGLSGQHRLERHRQAHLHQDTRGIIDAILDGSIKTAPTKKIPYFNFEVPTELPGVDSKILDPRDTYADASEWETKAKDLASASRRTSSSTRTTKLARPSFPPARSCKLKAA